jgi:hypothetical protein
MSSFPGFATVDIRLADDELARMANMMGALGQEKARVALARAVNRVTRTVYGRVVRAVARQSSIPVARVRSATYMRLAAHKGDGPIQGVVGGVGDPIPLKHFSARQFSFGVKAKIYGSWKRFPGTFIMAGTFRSGQEVANGHVFQRVSVKSKPIAMQYGPSIPDELVRDQSATVFEETVRTMLPARAMHELTRLLNA